MADYYNEIDGYAAAWLRNLIAKGVIAPGDVDERSIEDVKPEDLRGYTQCHFFAGIGVWSYALRQAGWPSDKPVWTGSCPCQPFSQAGKGDGFADERHLWPAWYHLIEQCRPAALLGEQVASKAAEPWIDLVHADLETLGYAFGSVPFPASGNGAPHIRDRNYWFASSAMGDAVGAGLAQRVGVSGVPGGSGCAESGEAAERTGVHVGRVADNDSDGREPRGKGLAALGHGQAVESDCGVVGVADSDGLDTCAKRKQRGGEQRLVTQGCGDVQARPAGPTNGLWGDADWLLCRDGKWRPVEPGTFPLVVGAPNRVGRLRAYGNAIVAPAAAEFIAAAMEAMQ